MISSWWLVGETFAFVVIIFYMNRISYYSGIWDGAFNHFLPVVQQEMLFYDRHRAEQMLQAENLLDREREDFD